MHHTSSATLSPAQRLLRISGLWIGLVLLSLLASSAWADPPGRAGRIAEVTGKLWLYAPESDEWVEATRNRPVTTGERLSTDANSRAEIRIGSTTLRLDEETDLEVLELDDDQLRVHLHRGSVAARLRTGEAAREFSLVTAEGKVQTQIAGSYRFDRIDAVTHVTTNSGQAHFQGTGAALTVMAGQRAEFWGEGNTQYSLTEPHRDAFTDWVIAEDRRDGGAVANRYVSPEMTGAEDLDRNGRWETSADYGPVWYPTVVAAGWAPYRMGRWAWVSPWGWTWVDDAPWGFAPFHYGRWAYHGTRWGWTPGRYVARPVYAPALVAWVGGSNVSVSVSVGGPPVGWFPLAPREVYVPGYRFSEGYIRRVNGGHVTNITHITTIVNDPGRATAGWHYANRGPRGMTVVPADVIRRREPVRPSMNIVDRGAWRDLERGRVRYDSPVQAPPVRPAPVRRADDVRPGAPGLAPSPRWRSRDAEGPGGRNPSIDRDGGRRDGNDRRAEDRRGDDRREGPRPPGFAPAPSVSTIPSETRRPDADRFDRGGRPDRIGALTGERVGAPTGERISAPTGERIGAPDGSRIGRPRDRDGNDFDRGQRPGFDGNGRGHPGQFRGEQRAPGMVQPAPVMPAQPPMVRPVAPVQPPVQRIAPPPMQMPAPVQQPHIERPAPAGRGPGVVPREDWSGPRGPSGEPAGKGR
jgi:hypothetical protein